MRRVLDCMVSQEVDGIKVPTHRVTNFLQVLDLKVGG
jgi:hypothetical protein